MESQAVFQVFFQGERPLFRVVCKSPCLEYSVLKTAISRHCLELGSMAGLGWQRILGRSWVYYRLLKSHGCLRFWQLWDLCDLYPFPLSPFFPLWGKWWVFSHTPFPYNAIILLFAYVSECCLEIYQYHWCREDTVLKSDFLAKLKIVSWRQCLEMTFIQPWVASRRLVWLVGRILSSWFSTSFAPSVFCMYSNAHNAFLLVYCDRMN